jgi:hypothetical protein
VAEIAGSQIATGGQHHVANTFSPSAVRKRLGRPKFDEIYSKLSETPDLWLAATLLVQ